MTGTAKQVFRRPRRGLGAGPRDSPQEGWDTRLLVRPEGNTVGLLSASEETSSPGHTLKVDNTLGQSHQEGWGEVQNSCISQRLGEPSKGPPSFSRGSSPKERDIYRTREIPGGASLTMMSLGCASHVESGSRVSVRSAELQCRTTLIGRRRDPHAQPAHRGAGRSKDHTSSG